MPKHKHDAVLLFRENFGKFYNGPTTHIKTEQDIKAGEAIGLSDS